MTIPLYLAVAQWVVLLTLGALVAVMYRQLGRQLSIGQPSRGPGPEVGSQAGAFGYTRLADGREELFRPGGGQAALLAFADPTCPACEELVASLNEADAGGGLGQVRPLVLVSEPPSYLQISGPFRENRLPLGRIGAGADVAAYRASATPLLVAIDAAGVVRAAGPATSRGDVRAFVRACLLPRAGTAPRPVVPAGPAAAEPGTVTAAAGEER